MIYIFICDDCKLEKEFNRCIKKGPPKKVFCKKCKKKMHQDYSASAGFILKGGGWSGKEIKRRNERTSSAEKAEEFHDNLDTAEKESEEVLKERRKGKQSFKKYKKHNKEKVKRYYKNMKKGIKPK